MTTALTRYQPQTLGEMMEVGKILAASGFFSDIESQSQAVAKIIAGQEAGFGPMASLMGIHIVHGRPELGSNLLAASIKRSGKYNYRVLRISDEEAAIQFFERVDGKWEPVGDSVMTMKEVVSRQLHMDWDKKEGKYKEKATWKKFPRNMLFAAALRNGVKWYAPDVLTGPFAYADEFDEPAGVFDVIEADYKNEIDTSAVHYMQQVAAEVDSLDAELGDEPPIQATPEPPAKPKGKSEKQAASKSRSNATATNWRAGKAASMIPAIREAAGYSTNNDVFEGLDRVGTRAHEDMTPEQIAAVLLGPDDDPDPEQPALLDDDAEATKATAVSSYEEGA